MGRSEISLAINAAAALVFIGVALTKAMPVRYRLLMGIAWAILGVLRLVAPEEKYWVLGAGMSLAAAYIILLPLWRKSSPYAKRVDPGGH